MRIVVPKNLHRSARRISAAALPGITASGARKCPFEPLVSDALLLEPNAVAEPVLAQIAAKELGLAIDRVAIVMGDTSVVPYDSSTSASRSTVFMGNAVVKACADIRSKLSVLAA